MSNQALSSAEGIRAWTALGRRLGTLSTLSPQPSTLNPQPSTPVREGEFCVDNQHVRVRYVVKMMLRAGLVPWGRVREREVRERGERETPGYEPFDLGVFWIQRRGPTGLDGGRRLGQP